MMNPPEGVKAGLASMLTDEEWAEEKRIRSALCRLKKHRRQSKRRNVGWENAKRRGRKWSETEDELIMRTDITYREKAAILGRSRQAVGCRLSRLENEECDE